LHGPGHGNSSNSAPAPGRFSTVVAYLALVIACYSLWRLDTTLDRLHRVSAFASRITAEQNAMRAALSAATTQDTGARVEMRRRLDQLAELPAQFNRLDESLQDLQARSSGPQRAWAKTEASFLLDAAQRSVAFDRDLPSAMVALESADARLAVLLDPGLLGVRQQIARELQALRAVPQPDLATILLRLASAEAQAADVRIKGILTLERPGIDATELPEGWWARGWAVSQQAIRTLISVRKVDDAASRVVYPEEQLLRRQHLQLLLFAARNAVVRRDTSSYRSSLAGARQWLGDFFDLNQPAAEALLDEISALEPINIAPRMPDISNSARMLRDMTPDRSGTS
jgi:uroporphyrin-III C-methyltransferase